MYYCQSILTILNKNIGYLAKNLAAIFTYIKLFAAKKHVK